MMRGYRSIRVLQEADTSYINRKLDGLLKDCTLGSARRTHKKGGSPMCHPRQCATCGWNPREQKRRQRDILYRHKSGLWGF